VIKIVLINSIKGITHKYDGFHDGFHNGFHMPEPIVYVPQEIRQNVAHPADA